MVFTKSEKAINHLSNLQNNKYCTFIFPTHNNKKKTLKIKRKIHNTVATATATTTPKTANFDIRKIQIYFYCGYNKRKSFWLLWTYYSS